MNTKYKYEKNDIKEKAKQSHSMAELLTLYGIKITGGNYTTMRRHIIHYDIDISHWTGQGWLKGKTHNWSPKTPLFEIMVKNSTYGGGTCKLKEKLFKEKIFERKCYKCNLTEWLGRLIPTELEHINGDKFDCRRENLTILCPNCHALTNTHAGKNKGKYGATGGNRTHTPEGTSS